MALRGRGEGGKYLHDCDVCGKDCTAGSQGGPATSTPTADNSTTITRCYECQEAHRKFVHAQMRLEQAVIDAAMAVEGSIAEFGIRVPYDEEDNRVMGLLHDAIVNLRKHRESEPKLLKKEG